VTACLEIQVIIVNSCVSAIKINAKYYYNNKTFNVSPKSYSAAVSGKSTLSRTDNYHFERKYDITQDTHADMTAVFLVDLNTPESLIKVPNPPQANPFHQKKDSFATANGEAANEDEAHDFHVFAIGNAFNYSSDEDHNISGEESPTTVKSKIKVDYGVLEEAEAEKCTSQVEASDDEGFLVNGPPQFKVAETEEPDSVAQAEISHFMKELMVRTQEVHHLILELVRLSVAQLDDKEAMGIAATSTENFIPKSKV
jgi:hypothetical protein